MTTAPAALRTSSTTLRPVAATAVLAGAANLLTWTLASDWPGWAWPSGC